MAYEKNTWKSGDVVTSAKLNNMENGIAEALGVDFVFKGNADSITENTDFEIVSGKTAAELSEIVADGGIAIAIYLHMPGDGYVAPFWVSCGTNPEFPGAVLFMETNGRWTGGVLYNAEGLSYMPLD